MAYGISRRSMMAAGALVIAACPVWAVSFTEDFSDGMTGWTIVGDVIAATATPPDGFSASLYDGPAGTPGNDPNTYSAFYQALNLGPGTFTLEYDFLSELSDNQLYESTLDEHFAWLAFSNSGGTFVLGDIPDDMLSLQGLTADSESFFGGTVTASSIGGDWRHYTVSFTTAYSWIIPAFDLNGLNRIGGDSTMWIDNIHIYNEETPIPEPASALLLGVGGLVCWAARSRRRSSN
ncbi:MAG: PEP-CTERM sorting domain-containing protein [Candidatus Hydrogenedentes bacterium]|nr:PEP-CTERM sorting domain-containing protein [Candidatus Hydrogenedentota bacterium]